jgi:putative heme transporter
MTAAATSRQSLGRGSLWRRHRRAITAALAFLVAAAFAHYVLPHIVSLGPTLNRLRHGHVAWFAVGVVLEACSLFGEIALFRGVFARPGNRIGWTTSTEITLAGAAATKLVAAAGAGGVAVTVWGLRACGLSGAEVADGMVCFGILTYGVYLAAVAVAGFGIWFGLFSGPAPVGLTLIPAALATAVILIALSMLFANQPVTEFLQRRAERSRGRASKWWHRAAAAPRSLHAGLLCALAMVKRRDPSLLGALAYWGFDIGALWASYRAFGHSPAGAVLVLGYYLGTAGNLLPLPGGIGGVEAGMIGSFVGFRVKATLATLAVLGYRTISYWLPTVPGAVAYMRLRRAAGTAPSEPQ